MCIRDRHPDAIALTYINCSAAVKALSDVIVTSSSAEKILLQMPKDQKIIFGPDRNLGPPQAFAARCQNRHIIVTAATVRPSTRPNHSPTPPKPSPKPNR